MPLTPADVHNVAFKKPPIGKRGYDEEEVDAFLDEVERELARLIEENNELRAQVERGGRGGAPAGPGGDVRLAAELNDVKAQLDRVQRDKAAAEQAARAMQAELEQVRSAGGPAVGADGEQQALRVLMMAQRTADDHVSDARREADQLLTEARSKAEEVTREARAKADALERDARQRHQEAMGGLDAKRTALQKHIEELKQFEREYRTRLKAYLESQLRDLDGRGQGLDVEMTRGGEGTRAVGGNGLATAGLAGSYSATRSGALETGR
ncbi:DivIVA domain-containing protein [Micromonospora peucetia]|uniref:Cell wall synthesis protein Wag31 n=1 Tax=Micromonospora peucetia TaxID=47871 RepID=A0A1C6VQK4_9ACTN|nr:DivIVA domain-containing protein [Micromonospora peucetia]MCX4388504.1 DivIVA domain-containing protein [Micromonospora peucetia]WSA30835.1 DivIVA domain-containing protein [Micromonospora peucetia]SCL68589.1 DivIVA domain-containing protein [Micromonospora peucetia]